MLLLSRIFRTWPLAAVGFFMVQIVGEMASGRSPQATAPARDGQMLVVTIRTDRSSYSQSDSVKLSVSLNNVGDAPVYVDRRMFWTGFGGGLKLEIRDEQGTPLPAQILSDATMPPPKVGDSSILIRLDGGFFYGTSVNLLVKDFFPKAGRYSIRVIYKSWLRKELVAPELRELPAIWADAPEIVSAPLPIQVGA